MELIADILLGAGAIAAGAYCLVLSRRLKALNRLESGMGGAIAVLSAQVDDMTRALQAAQGAAGDSTRLLDETTVRAERAAARLELMLATLHDLPEESDAAPRRTRVLRRRGRGEEQLEDAA